MRQAKKVLAVLLAMAMLCGVAAIGVFAAKPITAAEFSTAMAEEIAAADIWEDIKRLEEQQKELEDAQKVTRALDKLVAVLVDIPPFLKWTVFSWGCSIESMNADLEAEMAKENFYFDDILKWMDDGTFLEHMDDLIAYCRAQDKKLPEVIKKNCVFYVDWYINYVIARVK